MLHKRAKRAYCGVQALQGYREGRLYLLALPLWGVHPASPILQSQAVDL